MVWGGSILARGRDYPTHWGIRTTSKGVEVTPSYVPGAYGPLREHLCKRYLETATAIPLELGLA